MPFGRRSPLEALALPGVILAYKYSQFRQRRREAANRRVTERELTALHHKILLYLTFPLNLWLDFSHFVARNAFGRRIDSTKYCHAR
uniref:Uncharacterized protein n=1 Tax=Phlebotomus papatasi TaxID=29031 RepID=A0A1B0GQR0_PHLPP